MIEIRSIDHVGIRVVDAERSLNFYAALGFLEVFRSPDGSVRVLRNDAGVEINLIVNAVPHPDGNVLMDASTKYPGFTHAAFCVSSVESTALRLTELGLTISEGPVRLGNGVALFVRDPDGNVLELRQPDA